MEFIRVVYSSIGVYRRGGFWDGVELGKGGSRVFIFVVSFVIR